MRLYRVQIRDSGGRRQRLLVAAETEREARSLALERGRVERIQVKQGPCPTFGTSRVIGSVLQELSS